MKKLIFILILFFQAVLFGQEKNADKKEQIVEVSCGQCNFGMKGSGCDLAVKIEKTPYFVVGADIDDYGDAHAEDGFCSKVRKAKVTGSIVNNKFVLEKFELLPEKLLKKKNNKK